MSKQESPELDSQTPSGPVCENLNGVNYETVSMIRTDPVNHTFMHVASSRTVNSDQSTETPLLEE